MEVVTFTVVDALDLCIWIFVMFLLWLRVFGCFHVCLFVFALDLGFGDFVVFLVWFWYLMCFAFGFCRLITVTL